MEELGTRPEGSVNNAQVLVKFDRGTTSYFTHAINVVVMRFIYQ